MIAADTHSNPFTTWRTKNAKRVPVPRAGRAA